MNPLLSRHLYSSARRDRFFWGLGIYLLGVGLLISTFSLLTSTSITADQHDTISMQALFTDGRALYWFSSVLLILTALLLVPISALGAIAGERETRTLDLLLTTTLKPATIVLGKFSSTILTGTLYILAPVPILMGGYWISGIPRAELIITFLTLIVTIFLSTAWALMISSYVKKTVTAVIIYYTLNLIVVPILAVLTILIFQWLENGVRYGSGYVLEAIRQYGWLVLVALHPISMGIATDNLGLEQGSWFLLRFDVRLYDTLTGSPAAVRTLTLPSPWIIFIILNLIIISLLLWLTTRRLKRPDR